MRILIPLIPLLLVSCANRSIPKQDRYQMEMTLHKTRADLEELKHDLHSQKMAMSILDGKMVNQEDSMSSLKKETFDNHQAKLDQFGQQINSLEKKLTIVSTKQEEIFQSQQKFSKLVQEMHKAIAQSKEKITEMEKVVSTYTKSIGDLAKLKKNVEKMSKVKEFMVDSYRVKAGDTLDTIAKLYNTKAETLSKINHLESDRLITGQEILVPSITSLQ